MSACEREPDATPYPPYVLTEEEKQRWDVCQAIAWRHFGPDAAEAWMVARVLYQGDIPLE